MRNAMTVLMDATTTFGDAGAETILAASEVSYPEEATNEQAHRHMRLSAITTKFLLAIIEQVPESSTERSSAIHYALQAKMWANAAIAAEGRKA